MAEPGRARWPRIYRWFVLFFVLYPLVAVFTSPTDLLDAVAALAATVIFLGLVWVGWRLPGSDPRRESWVATAGVLAIVVISTLLVLHGRHTWLAFFYYASTGASPLLPRERTLALMGLSGIAAGLSTVAVSGDAGEAAVQGVSVTVIGLLVFSVNEMRRTNRALVEVRHELARLAVADERARIARDLHDTLGHSLSLIALKSELAGRLLPDDPERARAEIGDVEQVAREALASVRETVSGFRRPSLGAELDGARRSLAAADIEIDIEAPGVDLPPAVDAVLAWTVREATTNVLRHSGASRVRIRVDRDADWVVAGIEDDGRAASDRRTASPEPGPVGSGLAGLAERVHALGGGLEAGSLPTGGFRLDVRLPLESAATGSAPAVARR
ncbi:MAG TPA: sensor histidine kinase [Candidatus Limnocylindrales bacterium]